MGDHHESAEFEARIDDDGRIAVPSSLRGRFWKGSQSKVYVRLTRTLVHSSLKRRDVNEEEIQHIAALQLETREQVVKFLLSEGALKNSRALKARRKR